MNPVLPYKSVAVALLFTVFLGPVGLLYATLWGGMMAIMVGVIILANKMLLPMILLWLSCAVWSVAAVEKHNRCLLALVKA